MNAFWLFISKAWDNEWVRGATAAVALVLAAIAYTVRQQAIGAAEQKQKEKEADSVRLEEIRNESDAAIDRADKVSVNRPSYGDDRMSDEPLPDPHYRD